jgi:hypothetical protein
VSVVATETSVLVEQEAELCEREREFEEKLQREAEERLAIRIAYIREMGERLARQAGEDLEQSQARRRREEEVEKAKLEALEMQWYCSSHTLYIRLVQHRTNYFPLSSLCLVVQEGEDGA